MKPAQKLYEMREFGQQINNGEMKLDSYMRCLQQFMIENPTRQEFSLEQPIDYQRRNRCHGEFCNSEVETNSRSGIVSFYVVEHRLRFPAIGYNNPRKISLSIIDSVKKRRSRVI